MQQNSDLSPPVRWSLLSVSCVAALVLLLAAAIPTRAQDPSPAVQKAIADAKNYELEQEFPGAMDSLSAALKATRGQCVPCLDALARVQMKMEMFKESAATAAELARQSPTPQAKAQAEYRQGLALYEFYFSLVHQNDNDDLKKNGPGILKQAEAVLAHATADDAANEPVRMLHGRILAAQQHDTDASREFAACAATAGVPALECERARRFAGDVALARNELAPTFTARTIDGKSISLDSLAGKIVLIDFWATWCKYCIRDSDYVQSMLDSFDKDRFVLLEVSADKENSVWKHWVEENHAGGIQTRDENGDISGLFHVGGYPTYIVLDGDSTVRYRISGAQGDLKGQVRKLLAEQDGQKGKPQHTGSE
jgi:peroxiredoxin